MAFYRSTVLFVWFLSEAPRHHSPASAANQEQVLGAGTARLGACCPRGHASGLELPSRLLAVWAIATLE